MIRLKGDVSDVVGEITDKPFRLSDEQRNAVLSDSRYTRVIAGAGAGKTETLTRRIAYLLLVENVEPASIVAFTFTEKAAQSMKSRIYQRVEQIAGSSVAAKLGEMYIGTIHAYTKRILEDYFNFGNHGVLDDNQEIAFLMRHGWSLRIRGYGRTYAVVDNKDWLQDARAVVGAYPCTSNLFEVGFASNESDRKALIIPSIQSGLIYACMCGLAELRRILENQS